MKTYLHTVHTVYSPHSSHSIPYNISAYVVLLTNIIFNHMIKCIIGIYPAFIDLVFLIKVYNLPRATIMRAVQSDHRFDVFVLKVFNIVL